MNPISSSDLVIVKDPTQIQEGAESLTPIPSVDKCATEETLGHLKGTCMADFLTVLLRYQELKHCDRTQALYQTEGRYHR